jgi:hypothetical protein
LTSHGGDVIEIRSVRPEGKLQAPERATVDKWRLVADPGSGTLTLSGEGTLGRREPRVFPLPATGRADEVTTICLAAYRWVISGREGSTWRMLLLDREGRVAGAGMPRNHPRVLAFFPPEVFEPLTAVGIRVVSEWYDTPQALQAAHPGGASKVALTGTRRGRTAAIGLLSALVILIVVAVTVYLTSSH